MNRNNILYSTYSRLIVITLFVILSSSRNLFAQIWQQTSGPTPLSNQVVALAIDTSGYVFAGTIGGGVFLTTNKGTNWTAVNSGMSSSNVRSLLILSAHSLLAGTDDGVFLSTNNGTNWTQLNNGIGNNRVNKLAINSSGHILAGTRGAGMFVSTDNGANWTNLGLTGINITALTIDSSGYVFVGTEGLTSGTFGGGVYIAYNSGYDWYQLNSGLPSLPIFSLAVTPSKDVIAGTYGNGVFLFNFNSYTWAQQDTGLPSNAEVYSLKVNASGYIYAGLGNNNLGTYLSTDNGATWTSYGLSTNNVAALALDTAGFLYAGTYEGGVYRTNSTTVVAPPVPELKSPADFSTDLLSTNVSLKWHSSFGAYAGYHLQVSTDSTFATAVIDSSQITDSSFTIKSLSYETNYFWRVNASNLKVASNWSTVWKFTTIHAPGWTTVNDSLTSSTIQSLLINSSDYIFAGSYGGGVFRSTNGGTYWNQVGLPGTEVFSFAQNSSGYIFAGVGYLSQGAFLSTDNGITWNAIGLTSSGAVAALAVNSSNWVFAGTYGNVYLSKDNGSNWTAINNGLPSNPSPSVLSLAINSSGYIFAGMGYTSSNKGLYLSKDNGTNWSFSGLADCGDIHAISINSSGYIFAGTGKGIYISTDAGVNWTQNGIPDAQVMSIVITADSKIFAGTSNQGVFFSIDNGTNWTQINDGLKNSNVQAVALNSSGYIYAGTWGNGIYRAKTSIFVPLTAPVLKSPVNLSTDISITPVMTWKGATGIWSYQLQVSPDSAFSYSVFDTTGIKDTSYAVHGLSLETKYFWRVKASNEFGTSNWSTVWSFTTTSSQASAVTNSVTNISQTTATLNGTVNPRGLSTTVQFDYGNTDSYGSIAIPTQSPLTGNSNVNVSAALTNLTLGTLYHYRVRATNTSGTVYGADSTFTTLSNLATTVTNAPVKVTSNKATLTGTVNPNGSGTIVKFQYGINANYGTTITASPSPLSGNSGVSVSAPITGLTQNTVYHFRISATNSTGTSYGSDQTFTTYPTSISLSHKYTFGDVTQSASYQLIGIPGNGSVSLTGVIMGTPKQDWDAYLDNGYISDYLVEFDNSPNFTFKPGNGFWIISKNTISLSQSVSSVTIDTNGYSSIPLQAGWNIISNPYNLSCNWSSILSLNGLTSSGTILYSWSNSNWSENTSFTPYVGYYIYNSLNLTSLTIPYNSAGTLGKIIASNKPASNDSTLNKEIEISLLKNSEKITSVFAAVNPKASVDLDQFDYLAPPADFQDQNMSLINDSLSIKYKKMMKDCRSDIGNGKEFDLIINDKKGIDLVLNFDGLNKFSDYECYVMNNKSKKFYNLKDQSTIAIKGNNFSYKLLIGNSEYITMMKAANAPDDYSLNQNYPNPFNPSTTISYTLKSDSRVKLSVYNILGELVRDLIAGSQETGYHEFQFDASKLASGVYIYLLSATPVSGKQGFTSSRKMVLLK